MHQLDSPCSLQRATGGVTNTEVIILPGTYNESAQVVLVSTNAHGAAGQPVPVIVSTAPDAITVDSTATLSDVRIEHTGLNVGLQALGTVERVFSRSSAAEPCKVDGGTLIRDSVCWTTSPGGSGHAVSLFENVAMTLTAHLRNVTAVASGTGGNGISVEGSGGCTCEIVAKNVIAFGEEGAGGDDAAATAVGASTAKLTLEYSNYDSEDEFTGGVVTDPGTGTGNQMGAPLFEDFAMGDFHQQASSPTVNMGGAVDMLGTLDIDRQARTQGTAIDIGADEFMPPSTNNPGSSTQTTENPDCEPLRRKLARLKRKIKQAEEPDRKATLRGKKRKVRNRLRELGCP